mmetsp:Transcript_39942/g.106003  ORF Transcript_39942/g.106003 Transcript_39942/m.106003 type:complete len:346 (-) Transcript_39942:151-1188(-)
MFSRCRLPLACLLCGFVLSSLLSLQLETADVMLLIPRTEGVNDTKVIEEDGSRQDGLVIWAARLEHGELATENMTLTRDIRRRIDARFIVALNPAGGAGRSFSRRCKELFNASYQTRAHRRTPRIMHIPKTAGKTLEKFLQSHFTGHDPNQFKRKTGNFVTLFRHPVEWALSVYYFRKSGEHQQGYRQRQARLCMNGTGKAFKVPCIPKVTVFQFAKDVFRWYGYRAQLRFLMRDEEDTLNQTAAWVLSNCVLFGATDEVVDLEIFLSRALPMRTLRPSGSVVNAVQHRTVDELLTVGEYTKLVQLVKDELSMYYWIKSMSQKFRSCYGESRFQSAYRHAVKGHA